MKRSTLIWITVSVLLVSALIAAVLRFPWETNVQISGTVVDTRLAKPVAGAKVLIILRRKGLLFDSYSAIGTMSDVKGQFAIDADAPHRFHDIIVEASTPNDGYGRIHDAKGNVTVAASQLPPALSDLWGFKYNTFRGGFLFGRNPDIHFVGQRWSIDEP